MKAKCRNETGHQYYESKGQEWNWAITLWKLKVGMKLGNDIMKAKDRNETGQ